MLLLYYRVPKQIGQSLSFTFHYASTLYELVLAHITVGVIYIPLCFYFIIAIIPPVIYNTYLHSTMLLLYLKAGKLIQKKG